MGIRNKSLSASFKIRYIFYLIFPVLFSLNCFSAQTPVKFNTNSGQNENPSQITRQFKESSDYIKSFDHNKISNLRKTNLHFHTYPFIFFLLAILVLAFIKIVSPDFFNELLNNFLVFRTRTGTPGYKKFSLRFSNILIDLFQLFMISLLIFEIINQFSEIRFSNVLLVITGIFTLKLIITITFYSIFFGNEKPNIQISNVFNFNRALFMIILPLIFIAEFCPYQFKYPLIWFSAIIVASFFLLRTILIFVQLKNAYKYNYFYIFLYVFIFEISFFFVIYKEFSEIL